MSQIGMPLPSGGSIGDLTGKQQPFPSDQIRKGAPLPPNGEVKTLQDMEPTSPDEQAKKLGYYVNDVGNKVIVPMEGESFQDTMKRGAQHGRLLVDHEGNLTAEGERETNAEMATAPEKAAETMGAAATIGVAGPAMLAAPIELHAALGKGFAALVPALAEGVKGLGEWAATHPVAAKTVYEGLKWALTVAGAAEGGRAVRRIVDSVED